MIYNQSATLKFHKIDTLPTLSEILRMSASLLLMAAELLAILAALSAMPLVLTRTRIKINIQKKVL